MAVDAPTVQGALRGSRKHVLDWSSRPEFADEVHQMVAPVECRLSAGSRWMPAGHGSPQEARLETFGPLVIPGVEPWATLRKWWLAHEHGANTPNWDIALACEIGGRPGLILVEAKANIPELNHAGKARGDAPSPASQANHERICLAISEASAALGMNGAPVRISSESHYQLSNRVAFTWKLASLGIPTVLVYLGFLGDTGLAVPGFDSAAQWESAFSAYADPVMPKGTFEREIDCGAAPAWFLVRSRQVSEVSAPVLSV